MNTIRPLLMGKMSAGVLAWLMRQPVFFRASTRGVRGSCRSRAGRRCLTLGLLCCLLAAPLEASEDEIQGFIVDNSISHIGNEFYRYFTERLRDTSPLDFNLVVKERPSARWGSLVWVEFEGRTLYRRFLPPNVAELQPLAYEAADLVKEAVTRQKLESLLQDTYDLDRDEI